MRAQGNLLLCCGLLDAAGADLLLSGNGRLRVGGRDLQLRAERRLGHLRGNHVL
jgi:hypothetical protein